MAFDWGDFFKEEECSIGLFVEHVVYGDKEEYGPPYSADYIDSIATKYSILLELRLTLLLHQDPFVISDVQRIFRRIGKDNEESNAKIALLKGFIKTYAEDMLPVFPNEREKIGMLDIGRAKPFGKESPLPSSGFDFDKAYSTYFTTELARALLRYHNRSDFEAPQGFLNYIETIKKQPYKAGTPLTTSHCRCIDLKTLGSRWEIDSFQVLDLALCNNMPCRNQWGNIIDIEAVFPNGEDDAEISAFFDKIPSLFISWKDAIALERKHKMLTEKIGITEFGGPVSDPSIRQDENISTDSEATRSNAESTDLNQRPSYFKVMRVLLEKAGLPTKRENSHSVRKIKEALELQGLTLDRKTIVSLLKDLEKREKQ